jgi:hypothetical protein
MSVSPSKLHIATYNVLFKTTAQQTKHDLERLMAHNGVINLQEFDGNHHPLLDWAKKKGWGHFSVDGGTQEPILWDKSKYKMLDSGSRKISDAADHIPGRGHYPAHRATWVRLQDKRTGAVFTSVSVHTIARDRGPRATPRIDAISKHQFRQLADLTHDLKKHGPVIIGGDLNTSPLQHASWPREILHHAGLRSNWDQLGTKQFHHHGTHGHSFIDNFLTLKDMRDQLKIRGQRIVRGLHSDHDALEATYRLKK